jgi:predicted PurR-regulated permease PerM
LPVVALAWANDVPLTVAILLALACIVGDRLARARWVHHALHVGPLIATVGIGVGLSLIGISGSILGLFVVAVISALLAHVGNFRARSPTSSRIRATARSRTPTTSLRSRRPWWPSREAPRRTFACACRAAPQ